MTRTEEFTALRPLLFAIAYRILGSVSEAEDAVQETWLRYESSATEPASVKSYLSAVVTRLSIDVLRSARVRRESYVGPWFPEPLLTDPYEDPERSAELADSVSMAALLLLERLSPRERAVFVLREVFAFDFPEIASAVGRSEAACRQLAVRARRHMEEGRPRFAADRREREELAARFFDAFADGDLDGLRELLAPDVQAVTDSGGKGPALARPVVGSENVARLVGGFAALMPGVVDMAPRTINDQPGRDPARPGRQDRRHHRARRPRGADPDDPHGDQPGQARAPGPGRRRLGRARGRDGPAASARLRGVSFFVRPAGSGDRYDFDGTTFTVKADGGDTEGRVAVMEQEAPAGLTVPAHTHDGEDEMFYVLSGELAGFCGDERWTASAGAFLFLPRDVEHGFEVVGDAPARALTIVGPARFDALVMSQGRRLDG